MQNTPDISATRETGSREGTLERAAFSLAAKRLTGGTGLDLWYPYYAGYSSEFAFEVLRNLEARPGTTVLELDPWNGSGTTTAVASQLGLAPLGFDLNPAAVLLSSAKLCTKREIGHLKRRLSNCLELASEHFSQHEEPDALNAWLPPRVAAFTRAALHVVRRRARVRESAHLPPSSAAVALCIVRALRTYAVDRSRSNASWSLPASCNRLRLSTIKRDALRVATQIYGDRTSLAPARCSSYRIEVGDARNLPLPEESVDLVLTSPPYCTRIDYAKKTAFELAVIAGLNEGDVRVLRDGMMGTTTIRSIRKRVKAPSSVETLLHTVATHPSHRSAGYYAVNLRQYFNDAILSLSELARVMRPGAKSVLVVQNSFYKEIPIELSRLYCDIARTCGLQAAIAARKPVARTMTTVNTRSREYQKNRLYSEDVILLEKTQ